MRTLVGRLAVWGGSIVAAAVVGCSFDFDAPFDESGGGGMPASSSSGAGTGGSSTGGGGSTVASSATGGGHGAGGRGGGSAGGGGTGGEDGSGGAGGALVTVPCGESPCTFDPAEGGGCCWDQRQAHAPPRGDCLASGPGDACLTEAPIEEREAFIQCDDASDCDDGQVCCGAFASASGINAYAVVACADACEGGDFLFCDPLDPEGCPAGDECQPSSVLPDGYHVCR